MAGDRSTHELGKDLSGLADGPADPADTRKTAFAEAVAEKLIARTANSGSTLPLKHPSEFRGIARGISTVIEPEPDRSL